MRIQDIMDRKTAYGCRKREKRGKLTAEVYNVQRNMEAEGELEYNVQKRRERRWGDGKRE